MEQLIYHFSESASMLWQKLISWVDLIIVNIPNLILAALVGAIAYFSTKFIRKFAVKTTARFTDNKTVLNLTSNLSSFAFGVIILFIILGIFDLGGTINKILATAGVLGLAIGLALQDPMNNLFSGVFLSVEDLYKIGDLVETNGFFGTIQSVDLRFTRIKLFGGQDVIIPNKSVLQSPLTNYTSAGERRVELSCGVSYGDDLHKVENIARKTLETLEGINSNKPVEIWFEEFGDSSVNFSARYWIDTPEQSFLKARSEGIKALFDAFNENDITIPFPIRTLDFGIKGGEKLNAVMQSTKEFNYN